MANPIVSSLPAYVEEHREPLIAKSLLNSKSIKMFELQSDVKGKTALNLVDTNITFQDGQNCGFSASGSTTLSQRYITPKLLKVNHEFCDKNLLGTWAQYKVRIAAGQKTLPFEEDFVGGIVNDVNEKLEKMVWQGTSANTANFSGLLEILAADVPSGNTYSATSAVSAYNVIKAAYEMLPERAIKEDTKIFVSNGFYREFVQDLVSANLYHYNPENGEDSIKLPGTNVSVESMAGLNDTASYDYVVIGRTSNFFYGTDVAGDETRFDLWFSQDDRTFKLAIEFIAGVQVAYPDEIVFAKRAK